MQESSSKTFMQALCLCAHEYLEHAHNQTGSCFIFSLFIRRLLLWGIAVMAAQSVAAALVCSKPSFDACCPCSDLRARGVERMARESLIESQKDKLAVNRKSDERSVGIRNSRNCYLLGLQNQPLAFVSRVRSSGRNGDFRVDRL
jgi:hypothetical protein